MTAAGHRPAREGQVVGDVQVVRAALGLNSELVHKRHDRHVAVHALDVLVRDHCLRPAFGIRAERRVPNDVRPIVARQAERIQVVGSDQGANVARCAVPDT